MATGPKTVRLTTASPKPEKAEKPERNLIWCLFGVANAYDQPDHDLYGWWKDKPSLEQLATRMGLKFPGETDEQTLNIVRLWADAEVDVINGTHWRLVQVEEGQEPS